MKIGMHEPDWKYIGAVLANSGDVEQAEFLKAFIRECSGWGTRIQVEQQLSCVNRLLTTDERDTLSMLSYNGGE